MVAHPTFEDQINALSLKIDNYSIETPTKIENVLKEIEKFIRVYRRQLLKNPEQFQKLKQAYDFGFTQITDLYHAVGQKIFLSMNHCSDTANHSASYQASVNFCDLLSYQTIDDLLSEEDLEVRLLVLERKIAMMQRFFNMGNYLGASAIYAGLNDASICRLKTTFASLSADAKQILEKIGFYLEKNRKELFSPTFESSKAIVPDFSFYKLTFTQIESQIENIQDEIQTLEKKKQAFDDEHKMEEIKSIQSTISKVKDSLLATEQKKIELECIFINLQVLMTKEMIHHPSVTQQEALLINKFHDELIQPTIKLGDRYKNALSLTCESRNLTLKPVPNYKKIPGFIIQNSIVNLDKLTELNIRQKECEMKISQKNFGISTCFSEIKKITAIEKNLKRKEKLETVLHEFKDVIDYVANALNSGSIPNIEGVIAKLEEKLNDKKYLKKSFFNNLVADKAIEQLQKIIQRLKKEKNYIEELTLIKKEKELLPAASGPTQQTMILTLQNNQNNKPVEVEEKVTTHHINKSLLRAQTEINHGTKATAIKTFTQKRLEKTQTLNHLSKFEEKKLPFVNQFPLGANLPKGNVAKLIKKFSAIQIEPLAVNIEMPNANYMQNSIKKS